METINRIPTHCGDNTCAACVMAGNTIYLAHHAGGLDQEDIRHQMLACFTAMEQTLASVGAKLTDLVQINLYLRDLQDFPLAAEVFEEYLKDTPVARMTSTTDFIETACLCQMEGVAFLAKE